MAPTWSPILVDRSRATASGTGRCGQGASGADGRSHDRRFDVHPAIGSAEVKGGPDCLGFRDPCRSGPAIWSVLTLQDIACSQPACLQSLVLRVVFQVAGC